MTQGIRPDPDYKRSFFDKHGPGASDLLNVYRWIPLFCVAGAGIGVALAEQQSLTLVGVVLSGLVWSVLACAASALFQLAMSSGVGDAFESFVQPAGEYKRDYSRQDTLLARGDRDGAIASYEKIVQEEPDNLDARLRVAELLAKTGSPERASAHYREIQARATKKSDDVRASYRLIDLYLGWPSHEGRTLRELRRLIDLYPDSDVSADARKALDKLKPQLGAPSE